jgi:hypothetical protein
VIGKLVSKLFKINVSKDRRDSLTGSRGLSISKNVNLPSKVSDLMLGKHENIALMMLIWHACLHTIVNFSVTELTILSVQDVDSKSFIS